jgi:hypothetical protein
VCDRSASNALRFVLPLRVGQSAGDLVQLRVYLPALRAFFLGWHDQVGDLHRRHLTGQRKHLVHSDAGSDRCIAQARFANLLYAARK